MDSGTASEQKFVGRQSTHIDTERSVTVCVCTRRRPQLLRACLNSLIAQKPPAGWHVSLLVIENDNSARSEAIYAEARTRASWLLAMEYVLETEIGIPFARNRALDSVSALKTDWIAFIDDDEVAEADWLAVMCAAAERSGVDGVQGPVRRVYPDGTPDWLRRVSLRILPSGEPLDSVGTGNVMFRRILADRVGGFDTWFRFSGGEDRDFFFRAIDSGAHIIWEQSAVVSETVVPSRMTIRWQLAHAFRTALMANHIRTRRHGLGWVLVHRLPRNVTRIISGALFLPLVLLWPCGALIRRASFLCMRNLAKGFGGFAGILFRFRMDSYRTVDGH